MRVFRGSRTLRLALLVFAALPMTVPLAGAQGFPGGGGGGHGGGHGGMGGHHDGGGPAGGGAKPNAAAPDPLASFAGSLRALRETLLLRDDQVSEWTAMRDALQGYVTMQQTLRATAGEASSLDSVQRLKKFAEDERSRADVLALIAQTMQALVVKLDTQQTQLFMGRLDEAFAVRGA